MPPSKPATAVDAAGGRSSVRYFCVIAAMLFLSVAGARLTTPRPTAQAQDADGADVEVIRACHALDSCGGPVFPEWTRGLKIERADLVDASGEAVAGFERAYDTGRFVMASVRTPLGRLPPGSGPGAAAERARACLARLLPEVPPGSWRPVRPVRGDAAYCVVVLGSDVPGARRWTVHLDAGATSPYVRPPRVLLHSRDPARRGRPAPDGLGRPGRGPLPRRSRVPLYVPPRDG